MIITSTNNPLSTSEGHLPLSIFYYKDEKRFLRVSDSYEEIIERVVNSFQIRREQTVLLQTSHFTACRGTPVVIDSSAYPLLWSILEEVEVVTTEAVLARDEPEVTKPHLRTFETAEHQFTTPTSPVAGPSRDGLAQIQDARPTPSPTNASEDELDEIPTAAPEVPPKSDPVFQWDDEIQQDAKKERVEKAPATPQPEQKFKAVPSSSKTGPASMSTIKKEKQRGTDANTSVKLELVTAFDNSSKKTARSAIDDDTRFDVVIEGPDDDPTKFTLRGKNSVRKVLIAACKNFHLDPNQASLIHTLELEVDGELQIHNFVCPPDDTMAMCGIKAGSKLFVRVTEEDQDDYTSE